VASLQAYQTLVARCERWSVEDLGDLLHEIERDREITDHDRDALQARLYQLIWERAKVRMNASSSTASRRAAARPGKDS